MPRGWEGGTPQKKTRSSHRKKPADARISLQQGHSIPHAILAPDMYKRILLQISCEALASGKGFGIDAVFIHNISAESAAAPALLSVIALRAAVGTFFLALPQQ